jgi:hypothetical protein
MTYGGYVKAGKWKVKRVEGSWQAPCFFVFTAAPDAYGKGNGSTNGNIPSTYGVESPRRTNASAPATSNGGPGCVLGLRVGPEDDAFAIVFTN